ncbi:MAG: hypothetical protein ACRDOA_09735 [Streptosporangiaceae bacterium]
MGLAVRRRFSRSGRGQPRPLISRFEHDSRLDKAVSAGQRAARLIRPGKVRDVLHGVWLGHPLHPVLVQAPVGAWLSASIMRPLLT